MTEVEDAKLVRASLGSASRMAAEKAKVAKALEQPEVDGSLRQVVKPKSLSGSMKKAGIALVAAPDPITGVPGVALLATSYVLKRKEPASLKSLAAEARKIIREVQSLRL